MTKFSPLYKSFKVWKKGKKITRYFLEILAKHKLAPKLTLKQLRLTPKSKLDPALKKYIFLTAKEKKEYKLSLEVLTRMRNGESLKESSRLAGINKNTAIKYIKKALYKKKGRYLPKEHDSFQRRLLFFENGSVSSIIVKNSKDASRVAEYLNAVKKAVTDQSDKPLKKFKKKFIVDAFEKKRYFETDLEKLYEANEQIESPETSTIYKYN